MTTRVADVDESHLVETLEAVGEFDHGVGDMKEDDKDHPAPAPQAKLDMNKPKDVLLKAEKAVEGAIKSSIADAETMEAVGEFDHGIGDFEGMYGKIVGKDHSNSSGPALDMNKPKEMLLKAEKAVEGAIKSSVADAETMEAVGEFDHGIGDFEGMYGKSVGKDHSNSAGPALDMNKPKEMLLKAEKAVEGAIRSVIEKTGSARKVAAESEMRKQEVEAEAHTEE